MWSRWARWCIYTTQQYSLVKLTAYPSPKYGGLKTGRKLKNQTIFLFTTTDTSRYIPFSSQTLEHTCARCPILIGRGQAEWSPLDRIQKQVKIIYNLFQITGVGSGRRGGGGAMVCLCPPPLLTPYFYFPLQLYVYITLTNNYLAFFTYQLIILWTISIN